jgi:hypothetical protein
MDQVSKETDLSNITTAMMRTYQEKIHEYLHSKPDGALTDADVIVMIMNLSVGVGINVYYTLKQILPDTKMDYDFMRAKMVNAISDGFEKIKEYKPDETMITLTAEQVKEIRENGFALIPLADGGERRVTLGEIMVKRQDADKLLDEAKEKANDIANTPKIITPNNGVLPGKQSTGKIVVPN